MGDLTSIATSILTILLLPVIGALWLTKADDKSVSAKADKNDVEHLRTWLTQHQATDEAMFKETRESVKDLSSQLQHNFEVLIGEIRRAGNGKSQ